jgi:hypothetical protein
MTGGSARREIPAWLCSENMVPTFWTLPPSFQGFHFSEGRLFSGKDHFRISYLC